MRDVEVAVDKTCQSSPRCSPRSIEKNTKKQFTRTTQSQPRAFAYLVTTMEWRKSSSDFRAKIFAAGVSL
jgi:hypothetical protein